MFYSEKILIILTIFVSGMITTARAEVLSCKGNKVVMIEDLEEDTCSYPCYKQLGTAMSSDGIVEFYYCASGQAIF